MTTAPGPVSSNLHSDGRIDDTTSVRTPNSGERAVPYHCPFCAEQDLRPLGATPGAWHCRACTRAFSVKYLGMQPPNPIRPPAPHTVDEQLPTGGS